jgi:hypothetical protein
MPRNQTIATWLAFVCTALCRNYALSQEGLARLIDKYGIIHFLLENYELLHYYSDAAVASEVADFVAQQGGALCSR